MITNYLLKIFLKTKPNNNDPKHRQIVANIEVAASMAINILLFFMKLGLGIVSGSFAMISDAIHTLSDIVSSIVVWLSFIWSSKPADEDHPFGHGRAEHVGGIMVSALLIAIGFEFIKESITNIISPETFHVSPLILFLILITIILKEISAQMAFKLAKVIDSKTLKADAWHHRTDAISSIIVLGAFALQYLGISGVDGWAGLIVSGFILYTGIETAKDSIHPLLGEATNMELINKIKTISLTNKNVRNVHDMVIHSYGHTKACCLHTEISEKIDISKAHDIAEEVEEQLIKELGFTSVTIHIDPVTSDFGKYPNIPNDIAAIVKTDNRLESFHDLRLAGKKNILLDLVPKKNTTDIDIEALKISFKKSFKKLYPELNLSFKVEPKYHY